MVNDDNTDNVFYKKRRFADVEEDVEFVYPLVNEYNF